MSGRPRVPQGRRRVEVTERRRKCEFAEEVRRLAEEDCPQAEKIRLVCDNLSTHTASAFYEAFVPEVARRLARRVEFVYTPVHGSWLNMAEIEISALVRQCLKRRLPDEGMLRREVSAWAAERNRLATALEVAGKIAKRSSLAAKFAKQALNNIEYMDLKSGNEFEQGLTGGSRATRTPRRR